LNKQGFAIICFGLVVVTVAVQLLSHTLSDGLCANKIVRELPSPNGQLKAVIFLRDCGGADGTSSQLSVLASGDTLPNKNGNLLTQDEQRVQAEWQGESTLLVKYANGPKTYIKDGSMWVWKLPVPTQLSIKYMGN
jgi:hypothetical protein